MEVMSFVARGEMFIIEQLDDGYLVTVRDEDGKPFMGDDGLPYEIRVIARPGEEISMSIVRFMGSDEIPDRFDDELYRFIAEKLISIYRARMGDLDAE
ncbi:MAG: hypothetical protein N3G75_09155 [Methanothrix sp.]|nr:hypothetical protein [Methanothrix sp.]MCX8207975.1 hypothetical protein [Methanothrix sp.]